MRNFKKFAWITYMVLSLISTVSLGLSLFFDGLNVFDQLSFLIQGVGFAFVSGAYFGM
ncbi:MAG: hypothetical protein IJF49_08395 [Clostridia bacterium]|nr:hypothetical protein [Clostridia bacterium]